MQIGNFDLQAKVLIVAEIGNNHEGNFEIAKELVREAAKCGVAAVKFKPSTLSITLADRMWRGSSGLSLFELSHEQFGELLNWPVHSVRCFLTF
jgi:sialic acid synthase SpsE